MILKKKETAEQKLLKMIEASSTDGSLSSKTRQKVSKKQDLLSTLKNLNKLLFFGVVCVGVLVALEIKSGMEVLDGGIEITATTGKNGLTGTSAILPTVQNLPYYLAGVNRRNIFQPYEPDVAASKGQVQEYKSITRKTKHLKLVGISWLDRVDTASALIEDTEKQITYFLKKGEKIGNIKVETIYADSVELGFENEGMILKYEKPQL